MAPTAAASLLFRGAAGAVFPAGASRIDEGQIHLIPLPPSPQGEGEKFPLLEERVRVRWSPEGRVIGWVVFIT